MAEHVHLTLNLEKQGKVKGESTQESLGRKDTVECFYFEYQVEAAFDPSTQVITGRRRHSPIIVRKAIDLASPLLLQAITTNEKVKDATFQFFRSSRSGDGTTEQFYTVKIKNGNIASVKQILPDTKEEHDVHEYEEVMFTFQDIEWRHETGKTSAADSWKEGK